MPNLKKIKLNLFAVLRLLKPTIFLVIALAVIFMFFFLYRNVYQTISQAEILTELKKEVPEEALQKEKFLQILEKIKNKQLILPDQNFASTTLSNPFRPLK